MVWGFYCSILISGFSHCPAVDKTITHTNFDDIEKALFYSPKADIHQMMWYYC